MSEVSRSAISVLHSQYRSENGHSSLGGSSQTLSDAENIRKGGHSKPMTSLDEGLTTLQYARKFNLCVNFLSESPTEHFRFIPTTQSTALELIDLPQVFHLDPSIHYFAPERLEIGKDAALLLRNTMIVPENAFLETLPDRISPSPFSKIELPLLHTDNELDVLQFGRRTERSFRNADFSLEICDTEQDEGLEWPTRYLELPGIWNIKLDKEKLEISSESSKFLIEVMKPPSAGHEMEDLFIEQVTYVKNEALEPVTPPLLPLRELLMPFEPSDSAGQLEFLSDRTDPDIAAIQEIYQQFAKQDSISARRADSDDSMLLNSTDELVKIYSPLGSAFNSTPSSPPPRRIKPGDLKVEIPLTPPDQTAASMVKKIKTVSFPEMLHEYIPGPQPVAVHKVISCSSQTSFEKFFDEVVDPIARQANFEIEQEQLQEADSLLRADVPVVDFTLPIPPWKLYSRKANGKHRAGETELMAQRKLLQGVKNENPSMFSQWSGSNKLDRRLNWTPFPLALRESAVDDSIDDGKYLEIIMHDMSLEDVVTSQSLTWKPDGLRIMDELDESEDELEPTDLELLKDDFETVKKRHRDVDESAPCPSHADFIGPAAKNRRVLSNPAAQNLAGGSSLYNPRYESVSKVALPTSKRDSNVLFGDTFSASAALANFMDSVGEVTEISKSIPGQAKLPPSVPNIPARSVPIDIPNGDASATSAMHGAPLVHDPPPPLPANPPSKSFIVSTYFLRTQRPLMRAIGKLYEEAIYFERDFTSVPTALEADILLSPATGIVLTTMQKIKQRALPGQEGKAVGITGRLKQLSARYERIGLFVHEPIFDFTSQGLERARTAVADLERFANSLEAEVQIKHVASGEDDLAKWVVGYMLKYCTPMKPMQMSDEETMWELALRQVGFNAFAAQVVLANLTDVDFEMLQSSPGLITGSPFDAFSMLSCDERIRRFEGLLGGNRILLNVNRNLEPR